MTYGEQVREACAKIAVEIAEYWRGVEAVQLHHDRRAATAARGKAETAVTIAGGIRALPPPEAPPDEREALAQVLFNAWMESDDGNNLKLADAILRAGWRRNPC